MADSVDIPPLPPGFTLDQPASSDNSIPPLPPGFTLDSPGDSSSQQGSSDDIPWYEGVTTEASNLLGVGKYIKAGLETGLGHAVGAVTDYQPKTYQEYLQENEQRQADFAKEHPYIAGGANVAGNMILPLGQAAEAAGVASKGVPVLGQIAAYLGVHPNQANALMGMGIGGVQGLADTGTLEGGLHGAELGGVTGVVAPQLIKGAVSTAKTMGAGAKSLLGFLPSGEDLVGTYLNTPEKLAAAQAYLEGNPEGGLADLPQLRKFARNVLKTTPESYETIDKTLGDRAANSVSRVQQAISDIATPYQDELEAQLDEMGQNEKEAYDKLYADQTPLMNNSMAQEIQNHPEVQSAVKSADAYFRSRPEELGGNPFPGLGDSILAAADNGTLQGPKLPPGFENLSDSAKQQMLSQLNDGNTFEGIPIEYGDQIKRQLDKKASQAYSRDDTSAGEIYNGFANRWRSAVDQANPDYKAVRDVSAPLQEVKSIQGGLRIQDNKPINSQSLAARLMDPRINASDVADQFSELSPLQKSQLKVDTLNDISRDLGNRTQNMGAGNYLNSNEKLKLQTIIDNPDEYNSLMNTLQNEQTMARANQKVAGGSETDVNQATEKGISPSILTAGPIGWTMDAASYLFSKAHGLNPQNANEVAGILVNHAKALQAAQNLSAKQANQVIPAIYQKTLQNLYNNFVTQSVPSKAVQVMDQ